MNKVPSTTTATEKLSDRYLTGFGILPSEPRVRELRMRLECEFKSKVNGSDGRYGWACFSTKVFGNTNPSISFSKRYSIAYKWVRFVIDERQAGKVSADKRVENQIAIEKRIVAHAVALRDAKIVLEQAESALDLACDKFRAKHNGGKFIPEGFPIWNRMLKGAAKELRAISDARRVLRNAQRRLETATRAY